MGRIAVTDVSVFTLEYSNVTDGDSTEKNSVDSGISFTRDIAGSQGVQTLSSNFGSGTLGGLLYVPTLSPHDPCINETSRHVSQNTTRFSSLPSRGFSYIAIAPWTSGACANSYMNAEDTEKAKAIIFYLEQGVVLSNQTAAAPPEPDDSAWRIDGGLGWQSEIDWPVYAINANEGSLIMKELSLYSGNISSAPYGHELLSAFSPKDNVRLYCNINTSDTSELPSLWAFLLIVMGMLIAMIAVTSSSMHFIQRRRRRRLGQLLSSGQVDLRTLGIQLLTVPQDTIDSFPLFVYEAHRSTEDTGGSHRSSTDKPTNDPSSMQEADDLAGKGHSIDADPKADLGIDLPPISTLPRRSPPFPQPTCPICLDDYLADGTIVRFLPCHHIFHPACIDPMLSEYSTLCPVCKASVLPERYCPKKITNTMVRQQRASRGRRNTASGRTRPSVPASSGGFPYVRHIFGRHRGPPDAGRSQPEESNNLELGGVRSSPQHEGSGTGTVGSLPAARPPSVPRTVWARQRATAIFGRQARAGATQDPASRARPRWRRAVGAVFPVFA